MTPDDLTRTQPPSGDHDATRTHDPSSAALDAGLAAAFGGETTHLRPPPADPEAGTVIAGKYRLTEKVGEGGMGSVWAASQTEPVKRRVAVKLIKAGMDSKAVLARFDAERQALAVMDHPNIAKVLDGGVHDGRPYFVMELVKGVPITQFCDERKLTPQQRLELFVLVCQAIQHAHQKGVIHRDIKPSNVLVALYDDKPVPKVIDFGVAKATGAALTDHTLETGFGAVVGTPAYMSPEQASLNNLDIDTRSDVYSLGTLLYELLTGSPPFSGAELKKKGLMEMLRVVREEEPPRPSTKLSTADALPSLSANRGTEPKKLTGLLRNELDWIVMKALEKERSRRYDTANGFAADVLRFLSGEPVQAHPPSAAYRLKKFVRKHRGQVIATSLVTLALVAGVIGTTVALFEAKKQERLADDRRQEAEEGKASAIRSAEREAEERRKADAARVVAQAKEAEANAVLNFFQAKVFDAARPKGQLGGLGSGVTMRDAVVASLPALEKGFTDQPLVEAQLRNALGTTLYLLAEYDLARKQHERALELNTRAHGPDHPITLICAHNLATDYQTLNRPADALRLREATLATRKRVLSPDHPDTLGSMHALAISYLVLNRLSDARALCQETLECQRRVLPKDHPSTLASMGTLANIYAAENRFADALTLDEEVLATRRRVLPQDHPDTLVIMGNLASSYSALNRHADALKLQEELLSAMQRVLPKNHPKTLLLMGNLAISYDALNRHADALKLREEVLALKRRFLAKNHPDTLMSMVDLASSLVRLDRGAEAMPLLDEFLAHAHTAPAVYSLRLPQVYRLRGEYARKCGDPVAGRTTAEQWEKLNRTDAGSLFTAACIRAVTSSVQSKAKSADAANLAQVEADRAMEWLQKAVLAGFQSAGQLKQDSDLDPLRGRDDFKKLLADLEAKFPPKKEVPPPEPKK